MTVIKPGMINKSITRSDILPLSYIAMTPYTGSKGNMRYKIEKTGGTEEDPVKHLKTYIWPGPLSFDNTDSTLMKTAEFDFTDEGLSKVIDYLEKERIQYY